MLPSFSMPTGPDLVLHVDSPRTTPPYAEFEIVGWVAARSAIQRVVAKRGEATIPLALVPRPDVAAAFPDHPFASGFTGTIAASFLQNNNFIFEVRLENAVKEAHYPLAPPIFPSSGMPPADHEIT